MKIHSLPKPTSFLRIIRQYCRPRLSIFSTIAVLFVALAVSPPLPAQTLFSWPQTIRDVTRLTNVDDCLAAVQRVWDSTSLRSLQWLDTLPFSVEEAQQKLPSRVIETAARCSTRFNPNAVPASEFKSMLRLFIYADRHAGADSLVTHRLASISETLSHTSSSALSAEAIRLAILDTTINLFLQATPARTRQVIPYVEQYLSTPGATLASRLKLAFRIGELAKQQGDTILNRQWLERTIKISATATEAEKQQFDPWPWAFSAVYDLHFLELADSLRVGTDAYIRHLDRLWATTIDSSPGAKFPFPFGGSLPSLKADYWYEYPNAAKKGSSSSATTSVVRPVPDRVNLVLFVDGRFWMLGGGDRRRGYVLKRLKERFPKLEITMITRTYGVVLPLEPPSPEQEAEIYAKRLEYFQWPVTLGVEKTPWWTLDAPDRRRLYQPINKGSQDYTGSPDFTFQLDFLGDQDGRLVMRNAVTREWEENLSILIQALMDRTKQQPKQ
jgi:hypothetical protein